MNSMWAERSVIRVKLRTIQLTESKKKNEKENKKTTITTENKF